MVEIRFVCHGELFLVSTPIAVAPNEVQSHDMNWQEKIGENDHRRALTCGVASVAIQILILNGSEALPSRLRRVDCTRKRSDMA
jgi:hypothetical protein